MAKMIENIKKHKKILIFIISILIIVIIFSIVFIRKSWKNEIDVGNNNNTLSSYTSIPLNSNDYIGKNYMEVKKSLEELGFNNINVISHEVLRYDEKDEIDTVESIVINDEEIVANQEYSNDSEIIISYCVYKKCHVNIHLNFIPNLLFNKYNLIFKVNNNRMGELQHGVSSDYEVDVEPGDLVLEFLNKDNENILCKVTLEVTGNINTSYKINCYTDSITAQQEYIEKLDDVKENQVLISFNSSSLKYKNYEEVKKTFEELGFTNIKTEPVYDIYWGITSEGEMAELTIAGKKDFSRGDIFNNTDEIIIKYHMKQDTSSSDVNKKNNSAEQKSENLNKESSPQVTLEQQLEQKFPQEKAKKALIVAITNDSATDVFMPDGNTIDKTKFHNYSNLKFKEQIGENQYVWFYYTLKTDGTWTAKDDSTWHVENIKYLQNPKEYSGIKKFSGDIHYDGTNYIVTGTIKNAAEKYIDTDDPSKVGISEITNTNEASTVTEELLK